LLVIVGSKPHALSCCVTTTVYLYLYANDNGQVAFFGVVGVLDLLALVGFACGLVAVRSWSCAVGVPINPVAGCGGNCVTKNAVSRLIYAYQMAVAISMSNEFFFGVYEIVFPPPAGTQFLVNPFAALIMHLIFSTFGIFLVFMGETYRYRAQAPYTP